MVEERRRALNARAHVSSPISTLAVATEVSCMTQHQQLLIHTKPELPPTVHESYVRFLPGDQLQHTTRITDVLSLYAGRILQQCLTYQRVPNACGYTTDLPVYSSAHSRSPYIEVLKADVRVPSGCSSL